jgi:hypothetical protein
VEHETSIARERIGKQVSAATDTETIEELLGTMFSVRSVQSGYKRGEIRFGSEDFMTLTKDRPVLLSKRAPHKNKTGTVKQ